MLSFKADLLNINVTFISLEKLKQINPMTNFIIFELLIGMIGCMIGPFSISPNLVIISSGNVSSNDRARHSEDCRYEVYFNILYHVKNELFFHFHSFCWMYLVFSFFFFTLTLRTTDPIHLYNNDFHEILHDLDLP